MKIQTNEWAVGFLRSADPNAHSFHAPDRHSKEKKPSPRETANAGDDSVTIESHSAYRSLNNSATANVGNAISLSQTQDGFLQKVQESLQRMSELSILAQGASKNATDRSTYTAEFAQLQNRIRDIGAKMFKAANLFQPASLGIASGNIALPFGQEIAAIGSDSINSCLENTSNPDLTAIDSAQSAGDAVTAIQNTLKAVTELRVKVGMTIQHLGEAGEQLAALSEHLSGSKKRIRNGHVAEESTRFARYDILARSGTAMLAEANALPQSALRLLD